MYWLEFTAGVLTMSGASAGIGAIAYAAKTRGWRYFARLKLVGRKPARKSLSLEMRAELGADMAMDKWDKEFRKLVARSGPAEPSIPLILATMQEAVERAGWGGVAEKTDDRCGSCKYEDSLTYGSEHVKHYKTYLCDVCLEDERRRAAREIINNVGQIYA